MHELSLSSAIVDTAVRHARGRPVTVVTVRVGCLRQVVPEALEFCFGCVASGTLCEGARLELELVPARLRCAGCAEEWELQLPAFRCPRCGDGRVEVLAGDEFDVDSIEIEEVTCIAPR